MVMADEPHDGKASDGHDAREGRRHARETAASLHHQDGLPPVSPECARLRCFSRRQRGRVV